MGDALQKVLLLLTPEALAIYRTLSGISAIIEHANVRPPAWLDRALRAVIVGPPAQQTLGGLLISPWH